MFEVGYKTHVTIEAENVDEARKIFAEKYPIPAQPEYFYCSKTDEHHEVIGICEIQEIAIFETDKYAVDNESGIMELLSDEEQ